MEKVAGKVESKSRKGNSIKVNGDWYSTFKAEDLSHVEWKDEVEFLYEQKGQYKNIKGRVTKTGSSGGASNASNNSGGGGNRGGYSSVGVELGHAANLAMRMMEQVEEGVSPIVGTPEYYKQFIEYTESMYKVMKAVRAKVESGGESPAPAPAKSDDSDIDTDDIF